jgi:hypothetical protein
MSSLISRLPRAGSVYFDNDANVDAPVMEFT